jgi:hypothetical protein
MPKFINKKDAEFQKKSEKRTEENESDEEGGEMFTKSD